MVNVIFSDLLRFVYSHFWSTPLSSILTVVSGFFSEDENSKAKVTIYDICKKKCDDIGSLVTLLDEHKVDLKNLQHLA